MPARPPEKDEHLTLLPGGAGLRSAARRQLRAEGRERRQLEPGCEEVEIRVPSRGRSGSGALRGNVCADAEGLGSATQSHGKQAGSISQSLTHELLESKPQLRLVGARREVGHTAPLLAQSGEVRDESIEQRRVRVEQEVAPDRPERRRGLLRLVAAGLRVAARSVIESLSNRCGLQPAPRVRDARRPGDRGQRAETDSVAKEPLSVSARRQAEGPMEQVRALSPDSKSGAFEARDRGGRVGAEGIAPKKRREFVGGRERLRRIAETRVAERHTSLLGGSESSETRGGRHGIDGPVPIDEIRSARRRRWEDRV